MIDDTGESWVVIRLSATALWLPERDADELHSSVDLAGLRVVEPTETEWEPGALVPGNSWNGIRTRDDISPSSDATFRTDRDVALVKLPGPGSLERRLSCLGVVDEYLGEFDDVPGMTTQTIRGQGGRRMGLHLDNWDRKTAGERRSSRNRASLNFGDEPRRFLFVDHDVVTGHGPADVPSTETARRLVRDAKNPPVVVRVKVPKGWAYIAPTETLLHDAWSIGQRHGSHHASALGWFSPTHGVAKAEMMGIDADLSVVVEPATT